MMAGHETGEDIPATKPWSGGGREELADAVRHLMTATVASAAPPSVLADMAVRAQMLAAELSNYIPPPDTVPRARFADYELEGTDAPTMATAMPFDMIIGTCNPVAPPMAVTFDPPYARGTITYGAQFEGAPGCVHGAALAGAFDIILTAANFLANTSGPTVELRIRYRKPTLISQTSHFRAWVTRTTDRRIYNRGELVQDGVVTVEAEGVFAHMHRAQIASLHRRKGRPPAPTEGDL